MVGLPGDDRQKIIETTNLAKRINPDFAMFSVTSIVSWNQPIDYYDIELMVNDWSQFTLAKPVARTSPFDKRSRAVAYQCVRRLYVRASFLNSGHRKEADGLRAEPR
jgi:hypothetical protein